MNKNRNDQVHIDYGERLLFILEQVLRRNGMLLPIVSEQVKDERPDSSETVKNLSGKPDWYDDPFAVIARGRHLIEHPPVVVPNTHASSTATAELALAARNGKPISEEVRRLMDADRKKSETA